MLAFCSTISNLNVGRVLSALDPSIPTDAARLRDVMGQLDPLAPPEIKDAVDTLLAAFSQLANGDQSGLDVSKLQQASKDFANCAHSSCGIPFAPPPFFWS